MKFETFLIEIIRFLFYYWELFNKFKSIFHIFIYMYKFPKDNVYIVSVMKTKKQFILLNIIGANLQHFGISEEIRLFESYPCKLFNTQNQEDYDI